LKKYAKLVLTGRKDDIVYLDETGFQSSTQRDYGWAKTGQRVYGLKSGHQRPRTSCIGALYKGKLIAPFLFQGNTNTTVFNTWLKECLLPLLPKGKVIVMDNAVFHKSKETVELIENAGCSVLFLPPYSPDLNPIEHTWANLKRQWKYLPQNTSLDSLFKMGKNKVL